MTGAAIPAALASAATVDLPAGEKVFGQGDPARNFLVVSQGCVKVFARSDEGREVVLYRVEPGELCILTTVCLLGHSRYPAQAMTEAPTRAMALPEDEFTALLDDSPEFRHFVFDALGGRLGQVLERLEQLVLTSVRRRLAEFLVRRARDGEIHMTHEQLATEIGTAREVVTRHLVTLEREGLIAHGRGRIELLHPEKIEHLS